MSVGFWMRFCYFWNRARKFRFHFGSLLMSMSAQNLIVIRPTIVAIFQSAQKWCTGRSTDIAIHRATALMYALNRPTYQVITLNLLKKPVSCARLHTSFSMMPYLHYDLNVFIHNTSVSLLCPLEVLTPSHEHMKYCCWVLLMAVKMKRPLCEQYMLFEQTLSELAQRYGSVCVNK